MSLFVAAGASYWAFSQNAQGNEPLWIAVIPVLGGILAAIISAWSAIHIAAENRRTQAKLMQVYTSMVNDQTRLIAELATAKAAVVEAEKQAKN